MRRDRDDDDDNYVLKDGESLRRRLLAMDGRTVAVDCGPGGPHRPGFRVSTDQAAQAARDKAYDAMVKEAENAWKSEAQRIADIEFAAEPPLCEDAREDAYQRYKKRMANAWRSS
jgi:hypothetical protein